MRDHVLARPLIIFLVVVLRPQGLGVRRRRARAGGVGAPGAAGEHRGVGPR